MFLSAAIDIAPNGSVIGAILPETILAAKSYDKLRTKILENCTIHQIVSCPTDLFRKQGANVSAVILILSTGHSDAPIYVADRVNNSADFRALLTSRSLRRTDLNDIIFRIGENTLLSLNVSSEIRKIFEDCPCIGDLYHCGGGVSTGNDAKYTSETEKPGYTTPFYRNPGTSRFISKPNAYLCDDFLEQSKPLRSFMVRNMKFLTKPGIACSSIGKRFTALYLPKEGVTGINAAIWPPRKEINWLLAYLNSSLVTYTMKAVISRGNMTTIGSVANLPVLKFSEKEKRALARISSNVIIGKIDIDKAIGKIDKIIYVHLNLPQSEIDKISDFCANIIRRV